MDDELCLCFHVTKRKVVNFLRIENVRRASQLADCYGAGTGCGWCRPFLRRLFEAQREDGDALPTAADYAQARAAYVRAGKGTPPPSATPLPERPETENPTGDSPRPSSPDASAADQPNPKPPSTDRDPPCT